MANIIHMETEQVRQMAQWLYQNSVSTDEIIQSLRGSLQNLNWDGNNRYQFEAELLQITSQIDALNEQCNQLSKVVLQEVEQWEEAAAHFGAGELGYGQVGIRNPGVWETIRGWFINIFNPPPRKIYTLSEGSNAMQDEPIAQDLLAFAVEQKITFVIEETGERLGYQGDDGTVVPIRQGDSIGGGNFDPKSGAITIDPETLKYVKSPQHLAALLTHEMQHAIDAKLYPYEPQGPLSDDEWENFFNQPPEKQGDCEDWFEREITKSIDTEVRAYARSDAIEKNTQYHDDGVQTQDERQWVLDHKLDSQDYEAYYESTLAKSYPGKEFDVWIDESGNVQVDIKQPVAKTNDWWPF